MVLGLARMTGSCVVLELAEVAGERDLLIVGQILIAEDEYRIFVHAGLDRGDRVTLERTAAIDARHLSRKDRMQWTDRCRHRCASCLFECGMTFSQQNRNVRKLARSQVARPASG